MKLTFIGAAHEVTGSCTLIEVGNLRGLVDCGMEQGKDLYENVELPVKAGDIDFVLLTHAHIDHSGNLPNLVKKGYKGFYQIVFFPAFYFLSTHYFSHAHSKPTRQSHIAQIVIL